MRLSDWLGTQPRGTKARLAKACNVQWQAIHSILRGAHAPSLQTAVAIERFTRGAVSVEDLLESATMAREARKAGDPEAAE